MGVNVPHGRLRVPIDGEDIETLKGGFAERRDGTRPHEAVDMLAPRNTPVHAVENGTIAKLFTSKAGGLTILPQMAVSGYTTISPGGISTWTRTRPLPLKLEVNRIFGKHSLRAASDSRFMFRTGGGGGMCADKDGVEHARHDADAEQADTGEPDRPSCHDRGGGQVPRSEVAAHRSHRGRKVEQIEWVATGCKTHGRVRNQYQHENPPRQRQNESGGDDCVHMRE